MSGAPAAGIEVGTRPPARDIGPLTTRMFVRYAGASGDFNPIHYDDAMARSAGYPSVFAQGMLSAALLSGYAVEWLGADGVRRFAVRFREQVYPGDVLTCSGVVASVRATDEGTLVGVELQATVGERAAVTATAEFLLSG
ncbi:MAG TPA: MaoC/PaaZ C-terminal domain-containing protein [Pseudonocardia sp.]